jgi:CheY-like chemotaxis protein
MTLHKTLRILVVEDHADTLLLYGRLLEAEGYSAITADSFAAAIAQAERNPIDIVICDVVLPDGSGWALLDRLREMIPGLVGIVVSGLAYPGDLARSQRAGYCIHLAKPIEPQRLYEAIERCADAGNN